MELLDWLCHRHGPRCFAGSEVVPWILCARCTGLALGALVGLSAWTVGGTPTARWRPLAAAVVGILVLATPLEVFGEARDWWSGSNAWRYLLALLCGAALSVAAAWSLDRRAVRAWDGRRWLLALLWLLAAGLLASAPWWPPEGVAMRLLSGFALLGSALLVCGALVLPLWAWWRWWWRSAERTSGRGHS